MDYYYPISLRLQLFALVFRYHCIRIMGYMNTSDTANSFSHIGKPVITAPEKIS